MSVDKDFSIGSEWRKWDLHFHTPSSFDYHNKSITNENIIKILCDNKINVVCITDHNIIDTQRIKKLQILGTSKIVVLPGIEFCSELGGSEAVHFIGIFPENSDIESLWTKLQGRLNLTPGDISQRGGHERIQCDLVDTCDLIHELGGITSIHAGTKTNTVENIKNTLLVKMEQKKRILSECIDVLELGKPDDANAYESIVFKAINLRLPMTICSDNHNINNYEIKCNCWIKADPTFEGLKQILYEPKERVRISSICPDQKQDYQMINRVEITGNDNFAPQPIYFSKNLTCIIGGKSTGKSLLLHNMALKLDEKQVREKEEIATTNVKDIHGIKIYWCDGCSSDEIDNSRKIVYIPQTYLNRLSDEKEETTEIDTIIQSIVLQDENANQYYITMNEKIASHKQYLAKTILDFCQTVDSRNKIIAAKKEIGDKDGIENEIKKYSTSLDQLSKELNVTEDDIKSYQNAIEQIQQISTKIKALRSEQEFIESIESVLEKRDFNESRIVTTIDVFREKIEKNQKISDDHWKEERKQIIELILGKLQELENDLKVNKKIESDLKPKMEGNEQIDKLSSAIVAEKEKLMHIEQFDLDLLTQMNNYNTQLSILSHAFESFKGFCSEYVDGVNTNFINYSTDLEFSVNCVLRTEHLNQKINDIINQKSKNRFKIFNIDAVNETILTSDHLKLFIESILSNSSETLQLKSGYGIEAALREILTDWFNIDYAVKMDNDSIEDMSPGKKALILLKLLISLAESKCPILIDQPEDDLDNRSIFEELVKFIKLKKTDRQIIVVTHDANIVLGGDAELIIVANQEGKNTKNKKYRFEYRGGSIENDLPLTDENGNIDKGILNEKGIQTHICEILEGGEQAFDLRKNKYHFVKK